MTKQSKEAKRKAKAKAKKKQILLNEQSLATRLAVAIERLCEPVLPEYIDDSVKPDIVGRQILWQIGQIAWNIAVTGRKELAENAFQGSKLDAAQQAMVQKEIVGLVRQKHKLYPNLRTTISGIMVHIADGTPHLKVKLGDTFPEMPMPVFDEPKEKTNPICRLYNRLFEIYGEQHWWPCKSGKRWEIIAGAILTQNCVWTNVEKALSNLESANAMSPEAILQMPSEILQEAIRPAGFFKQKSVYLKAAAAFFTEREQEFIQADDVWDLRKQLLTVKGIGRETADSILLYAFQKPVFVIDAYTRRVAERHLHLDGKMPYDDLQKLFMDALPHDVQMYNEYHALIVALCKESCLKSKCGEVCKKISM